MIAALGELLPFAAGVAISPLPIIALILLLVAPKSGAATIGFLIGWMLATASVLAVFTFVSGSGFMHAKGMSSIAAVIKIVLGSVLLLLAVKEWRERPRPGVRAELPHWLSAVQEMK